jgi:uncharacterized membrane protein YhaH (DUF805 family)
LGYLIAPKMFKNPFSFNGRIRRTEFGLSLIIYYIIYFVIIAYPDRGSEQQLMVLLFIPIIWFLLAQGAKRCHDLSRSGWWQIIPFYGFWLLFQDGDMWPNQYGDNPKHPNLAEKDEYGQTLDDYTNPQ